MPLAALSTFEFVGFGVGACVVLLLLLLRRTADGFSYGDHKRIRRVEEQLDFIVNHLGLKGVPASAAMWKEAADAGDKIAAIKAYREETGAGLKEAKEAVEAYIGTRGR